MRCLLQDALAAPMTLAATEGGAVLADLLWVLAVAAVVAIAMQRLRLAVIPAYLLTGALVGPNTLGLVGSGESLEQIASLAIILLLFSIGLQLHTESIKQGAVTTIGAGVLSVLASIGLGVPVALLFGVSVPAAVAIALAFALSSTAVVLRAISDRRETHTPFGRLSLAILIVQDLAVPIMLVAIAALATLAADPSVAQAAEAPEGEGMSAMDFLVGAALRIGGIAALIVAGRVILPRLLHEAAKAQTSEVMLILSVAAALAAAAATAAMGFSYELGAFLAGFLLSSTPFRHQLSGQIGPARDLFVAIFFVTVGMYVDPPVLLNYWWAILLAVLAIIALKSLVTFFSAWALGAGGAASCAAALALAQGGEFSLVILREGQSAGLFSITFLSGAIAVVVVSLVATPALMALARRAEHLGRAIPNPPWIRKTRLEGGGDHALRGHVVIGGFGPVGRAVAEGLAAEGERVVIIEMNPATVRTQSRLGRSVIFGDASNADVLESAGVPDADALILTIPDEQAILRACQTARRMAPDIFIAVRASLLGRGMLARSLGANMVTVDEVATAAAMQREVLDGLRARRPARADHDRPEPEQSQEDGDKAPPRASPPKDDSD